MNNRSSGKYEKCTTINYFVPHTYVSEDIIPDTCFLYSSRQYHLRIYPSLPTISYFDMWRRKHVRRRLPHNENLQILLQHQCSIVVDGSFFTRRLWHISASWFVVACNRIIGTGDFLCTATTDYQSACTAEICDA